MGSLLAKTPATKMEIDLQPIRLHLNLHRTLPRAKKVSTGHFFTPASPVPPSSSPYFPPKRKTTPFGVVFLFGGRYRTRTYDLPHVKRML